MDEDTHQGEVEIPFLGLGGGSVEIVFMVGVLIS